MSQSRYEGKTTSSINDGNLEVGQFYDRLVGGESFSGREPNCCFLNLGEAAANSRGFINVSAISGFHRTDDGRAIALVDWDQDGDVDIWTSNRNAPRLRLLRNDGKYARRYLQLRLLGTAATTPRDAIGARVTVHVRADNGIERQVKTLRAGEGFLSQSSKWLHFGLGDGGNVDRVVVLWPGGEEEEFAGLAADQWFELAQGKGTATAVKLPERSLVLNPAEQIPTPDTDAARIPLVSTFPLPSLAYESWDGEPVPLKANGQPLVINFWASWCAPCMEELHEFKNHQREFEKAGIQVVALSVDGIGEGSSSPSAAQSAIEKMAFPFARGRATDDLVNNLHGLHDLIIRINDRPFAVPTSFLVDSQGRLSVIYRGKVAPATLIADAADLPAKHKELRLRSALLPGRLIDHPRVEKIATKKDVALRHAVAQILRRAGEREEAIRHYREMVRLAPSRPDILSGLGDLLLLQREVQQAEAAYRSALAYDPTSAVALVGVGNTLLLSGDVRAAKAHFERAVASDEEHAAAHLQLGVARQRLGKTSAAAESLRAYLELRPNSAIGHTRLASVLTELGEMQVAKSHFERAMQINPQAIEAANGLAWILATADDVELRDGYRALELATMAAEGTKFSNPGCLDTLAAAFAECGDFENAVKWQQRAVSLLPPAQRGTLEKRLELYRSKNKSGDDAGKE